MSYKIDELERKIIELEIRIDKLEGLGASTSNSTNKLSKFPERVISEIDKISTKNLVLISLNIDIIQTINELKANLLKIGWIKDTFFEKNFSSYLVNKGLVQKIEEHEGKKDCFYLTERGKMVADKLLVKLTKK